MHKNIPTNKAIKLLNFLTLIQESYNNNNNRTVTIYTSSEKVEGGPNNNNNNNNKFQSTKTTKLPIFLGEKVTGRNEACI
jgi:hypothetical protein